MDAKLIEAVSAALRDHLDDTNDAIEGAAKDAIRAVIAHLRAHHADWHTPDCECEVHDFIAALTDGGHG